MSQTFNEIKNEMPCFEKAAPKNKYQRVISDSSGNSIVVDVYDVLKAFDVTCPALQHLAKKALCVGIRGHKDKSEDLRDIRDSAIRAMELNK